jgi:Tol biopolymer transport system component
MKQNGTGQRRVTDLGGNVTFPDFAPAGDSLVFAGRPAGFTNPDIWTIGLDGTGLTQLTTSPALDQFPVYSPDGTKIAFRSNRTGTFQVWVMNADGSDQHALTSDANPKDQLPEWSPDGSRIAYAASSPATGLDIWVMNADGSDQHPLLADSSATFGPAWSPDGTRIAYLDATENTIETMDTQGGDVRVLFAGGFPAVPAWQPRVDDEE